MLANQI